MEKISANNILVVSPNNKNSANKYYDWIDTAKIMGIFLVVIGHGALVDYQWKVFIYSFHMPLFFFLSGLLYKTRSFNESLKRNVRTLLVPYFIINLICLVYNIVLQIISSHLNFDRVYHQIGAIVLGLGYKVDGWTPVCTPLWFVISLFFINMIMSLLKKTSNILVFTLISIIITILFGYCEIDTYIPIDSSFMAFPFFAIGFITKDFIFGKNFKSTIIIIMGKHSIAF